MRFPRTWPVVAGVLLATAAFAVGCSNSTGSTAPRPPQSSQPPASATTQRIVHTDFFDNPVTIGVKYDQPGFSVDKDTQYAGFDIDLATYIAGQLHFTPDSFTQVNDMDRSTVLGQTAKLVIATFSITQAREEGLGGQPAIDFAGPYMVTPDALLVKANGKYATQYPSVGGARICTLEGSTTQPGAAALPKAAVVLDSAANYTQCVQELEAGDVDAVFTDALVLDGYAADRVQYPGLTVEPTQYGGDNEYGIGVPRGQVAACRDLILVIQSFLSSNVWLKDFQLEFPEVVATDPTYQQDYKPEVNTVPTESYCE
jgi:glutamate transport system substrate-binding protein